MYIEPTTNIRLLKDVPLDNSYKHTLFFQTHANQIEYFVSKQKYSLGNYSYQRINKGVARVGICADNIYECNYMMFKNINFGDKWFYAFITKIEYVNNEMSTIEFEIDDIQTWLFEMQLKECYIERQHTVSDNKYEHIEPESIDFGNMVTLDSYLPNTTVDSTGVHIGDFHEWVLIVCVAPSGKNDILALVQNGMVSCAEYYICKNSTTSVKDFLENVLTGYDQNSIYSAYMFPSAFCNTSGDTVHILQYGQTAPIRYDINVKVPDNFRGYVPKNNKLFSSPYTVYEATDDCENSQYYYPELFNSSNVNFHVYGKYIGNPEIAITPLSYKGETENYSESFVIGNFPMASFASDTYRAWVANNGMQTKINLASSLTLATANLYSGNAIGAFYNATSIASQINGAIVAYNQPNKLLTTDNSQIIATLLQKVPRIKVKCLTESYLKQVDDYFTTYGYALNVVAVPNIHARKEFTFIKTKDCVVRGNLPVDAIRTICKCFDSGITWWVNGENVGNYEVDNSVL
jgi:hypothetical protein